MTRAVLLGVFQKDFPLRIVIKIEWRATKRKGKVDFETGCIGVVFTGPVRAIAIKTDKKLTEIYF